METLGVRQLNRAHLERQLLLRRHDRPTVDAVEHLLGLQAQTVHAPYIGLWSRLFEFRLDQVGDRLLDRQLVRISVMRGTIHLVSADDALLLRRFTQPLYERAMATSPAHRGLDLEQVTEVGRELLGTRPMTAAELRDVFAERLPDADPAACASAVRNLVPCAHVPPRGVWGAGGKAVLATLDDWIGPMATDPDPDSLVLRYLAGYGPASVRDMQAWCGLSRLGEVFERLDPKLRRFRAEDGTELYDMPDAPLPDPDTPAPVRLLPEYDNALRSHADRGRVITDEIKPHLRSKNDTPIPTFCVDGFVRGRWRIERSGRSGGRTRSASLTLAPFTPLSTSEADEVVAEATNLLAFTDADAMARDVHLAAPAAI